MAKVKEKTATETLDDALDRVARQYRSCHHEQDIADEVLYSIRAELRKFGLLDMTHEESGPAGCGFCGSKDYALTHVKWCIRADKEAL